MKLLRRGRHGRLLFRTYVVIVGGLVVTAALFDYGFGRLQEALAPPPSAAWARAAVALVERRLAEAPPHRREAVALELERELGLPVRLLPADAVVHAGGADAAETEELFDEAGRSTFIVRSPALEAAVQVGPAGDEQPPSTWLDFVPHLFFVAIFVLVGLWLWPLIRDVDLLTGAAHDFAADYRQGMSTRDKTTTLRDLAGSFDEMAARIRGLIQGQKDLTSALSHEIRTPLARIKFALAVLASKPPFAEEIGAIEEDVREIDRLIGTMLEVARLDRPDTEMNWQLIPADAWLEQAVAKCLLRDGQRIRHSAPAGLVRMDPALMDLAVSNLLVNACRYAETQVAVELAVRADRFELAVEDDGPGIPESDREAVFKAFTRLDDSRSRGTGGFGLGLAIVARIAALHGGAARAEASPLGGARIVVAWPRG
ncbi:MAG TPA: ATP-binding protein [Gammaproteobacteria bacterium]